MENAGSDTFICCNKFLFSRKETKENRFFSAALSEMKDIGCRLSNLRRMKKPRSLLLLSNFGRTVTKFGDSEGLFDGIVWFINKAKTHSLVSDDVW